MTVTSSVPFREAFRVWVKIGLLSFGGPAGQIALMHRILVEEKKWLSEPQFLHALNFCMLLPGPEAQQLATYSGWLLHGVRGGLAAGLLFILPGVAVMLALSVLYAAYAELAFVEALFFGIKAAGLHKIGEPADIAAKLYEDAERVLEKKIEEWGAENFLRFARQVFLQEIDAKTGKSIPTFGIDGYVDMREGLARGENGFRVPNPGKVFENLIILGDATGEGWMSPPGDIRAYDVVTGKPQARYWLHNNFINYKDKKITLIELAKITGIAQATLSRMETGRMLGTVKSHQGKFIFEGTPEELKLSHDNRIKTFLDPASADL